MDFKFTQTPKVNMKIREIKTNFARLLAGKQKNEHLLFGVKVYSVLVENFTNTFFVGGTVRDLILNKNLLDIDIATSATPEEVVFVLNKNQIRTNTTYKNFGVIEAVSKKLKISIATFRKEIQTQSRYPKIAFTTNIKLDSQRRDFTINALYFSPKHPKILDFHEGLADLKKKQIVFIGNPQKRIQEDPLRILRALRFALNLKFKLSKKAFESINRNFFLTKQLTKSKIQTEIKKVSGKNNKILFKQIIFGKKTLDKQFKTS